MSNIQQLSIDTDLPVCDTPAVFHIGDVIRKLRKQRGSDLRDVAERAQMSMTTLSELERGVGNQRKDTIERVAKVLGTTVPKLYAQLTAMATNEIDEAEAVVEGLAREADRLDVDVTNYQKNSIPVINEGEASPNGLVWDAESKRLSEIDEWTSRPFDFHERGAYAVVIRGDSM